MGAEPGFSHVTTQHKTRPSKKRAAIRHPEDPPFLFALIGLFGARTRIRTWDQLIKSQMLYLAELCAHGFEPPELKSFCEPSQYWSQSVSLPGASPAGRG